MKKCVPALLMILIAALPAFAAAPRFEKVTEHYYCFQAQPDAMNVGAVVTDDGILLINPPADPDLSAAMEALKRVSTKPVRWVVGTDYRIAAEGGMARFGEQGAVLIGSRGLRTLTAKRPDPPRIAIAFDKQIRLFPGGLEVRIIAVQSKARTGGDVAILIPSEKVLQLGDFYTLGSYPDIDSAEGDGSAAGWVDGAKQVLEAVPLLKAAIPPVPKPVPGKKVPPPGPPAAVPEKEKTLEEEVLVITGRGARSNLMEFKALLETAQKLRAEVIKLAGAGIARENLLGSQALGAFRVYNGFDAFALQLFDSVPKP
jgi:hypothetical protein